MSKSLVRADRTGPTTPGSLEWNRLTNRVMFPSTRSSKMMSALLRPDCGRACGALSIFTASAGRCGTFGGGDTGQGVANPQGQDAIQLAGHLAQIVPRLDPIAMGLREPADELAASGGCGCELGPGVDELLGQIRGPFFEDLVLLAGVGADLAEQRAPGQEVAGPSRFEHVDHRIGLGPSRHVGDDGDLAAQVIGLVSSVQRGAVIDIELGQAIGDLLAGRGGAV